MGVNGAKLCFLGRNPSFDKGCRASHSVRCRVNGRGRLRAQRRTARCAYGPINSCRAPARGCSARLAGCFVQKLTGSFTNVVGLPLTEVVSLLLGEGFPIHFNWLKLGEADPE
jgi:septum formation protein